MNLRTWGHLCWLPGCIVLLGLIAQTTSTDTRVVCYYTNWSVYRPGTAKFSPQNINPYLCTHLIYAFGGFTKENSLKPFDKYQDIEKGGYAKFTGLKTYNKNLKTMLAIGGWNEGSSRFSPMVANADRRKELVKNSIKFLRQNHFDGLDLDWEYPSFRDGGKARDRDNYAQLVQELREEFNRESEKTGRPRLLLTMAVPAGIEYINKGYDVPKLNKYLDWMNILSYDYHSAFEPAVNHHSPLYPIEEDDEYNYDGDLNIDHTIKHYLKAGADPNKLVLGIPTYGRSYTLFNPDANELGAPADGPGDMGDATRENGYLAYYEICENLKENHWQIVQPNPDAMGPYAFKDNQWVSYDDELIVRKKSEYVVEHGLGGIMFWSIDNDDFRGNCNNKPYPLIEAAKDALLTAASGKTDDNLVSAPTKTRKPITRTRTRPSSTADNSVSTTRVRNSGGRQTFEDTPSVSSGHKRIRSGTRSKARSEDAEEETKIQRPPSRPRTTGRRRKTTTTAAPTTRYSTTPSPKTTTPTWKTPEPPTTPDPGGDFKCEEDGFFRHPRDCKKYFWCLSGPADLGIIAHQFTCPAGLYFNKAADSCDYSQNVLCNTKTKTTTTTTTASTTSTTPAPTFSTTTRRVSQRITAATSRTTFAHTTTTTAEPEYYDEYEYEDDEFEGPKGIDPEEDPRVIKELVDLIKKVGGIEELEKYLKIQEDGTMGVTASGSTTPATISRSLYERVLSRANKPNPYKPNSYRPNNSVTTTSRGGITYATLNRNKSSQNQGAEKQEPSVRSRGPQGLEKSFEDTSAKGRPQYTTINRNRPSAEKQVEDSEEEDIEDDDEDEDQVSKTRQFISRQQQNQPEYVTIRRQRPSSVTDDETTTSSNFRNKNRGVPGEDIIDEVTESSGSGYVTLQRQRPSSDETTTSKYTTILRRRPATESSDDSESIDKEIIQRRPQGEIENKTSEPELIRRRSTTEAPEVTPEEKRYRSTTQVTTTAEVTTEKNEEKLENELNQLSSDDTKINTEETTIKEELDQTTVQETKVTTIHNLDTTIQSQDSNITTVDSKDSVTEVPTDATNQIGDSTSNSESGNETESASEKVTPTLFRPRPFANRGRPTTPKSTEVVTKVGETTKLDAAIRPFVRKIQAGGNRFSAKGQGSDTQNSTQNASQISAQNTAQYASKYSTINRASNTKLIEGKSASGKTIEGKIDDNGVNTEESTTDRVKQVRNRGKSRFQLTSTTSIPFTRRRNIGTGTATPDYEYDDDEQPHRTYRPTILVDLSSLTSADISFRGGGNRKHVRRRPTTTTTTEYPTETSLKTGPRTLARQKLSESHFGRNETRIGTTTEENLKTGPRTLTLARQKLAAIDFGRASRRVTPKFNETVVNTVEEATKSASPIKLRPAYSPLFRTTTVKSIEEIETTAEATTTALPKSEDTNEVTDSSTIVLTDAIDSTESDTIFEEVTTEVNTTSEISDTNTTKIVSSPPDDLISEGTTLRNRGIQFSTTERSRRTRPTVSSVSSTLETIKPLNRTRKVFIKNRRRTTVSPIEDTISTASVNIPAVKRTRPSYLSLRANQANFTRPNITRLRPIHNSEDAATSSETTRSYVRRIRPVTLAPRVDGEEQIKLSETNISENDYLGPVRNLPEDDTGKLRRRKVIRRIRPGKDAAYSKSEADEEIKVKHIRISNKTNEEVTTTNFDSDDLEEDPKLRKETFAKSESSDILRSKRIRVSESDESIEDEITESVQNHTKQIRVNSETTTQIEESPEEETTIKQIQKLTTNRNRNIIRKFRPSQVGGEPNTKVKTLIGNSKLFDASKLGNRTRKIIRRLRPISTTTEVVTSEFPSTTTEYYISTPEETGAPDEDEAPESVGTPDIVSTSEDDITETSTLEERTLASRILDSDTFAADTPETDSILNDAPESESPDGETLEGILTTDEMATPVLQTNSEPQTDTVTILESANTPTEEVSTTEEAQTEYPLTTINDIDTTQFTTEQETTTSTTPRPTRPSLIGRSRPAYRPRNRPPSELRTTTPGTFRRRFNPLQRNESKDTEVEDDKLKRYNKKYSPIGRTTTERARVLAEEITTEKITTTTTEFNTEVHDVEDDKTEEIVTEIEKELTEATSEGSKLPEVIFADNELLSSTTEAVLDTTIVDEVSTIILPEIIAINIASEETEVPTTQDDLTTHPEDITTIFTTERSSTTTDVRVDSTSTLESKITTESLTTELTSTTDSKPTETDEETTEFVTDIPETSSVQTDTILNDPTTETESKLDQDRTYKPIRYKPSDRPKLVINLNRTEPIISERQEFEDQKSKKFSPSRTIGQRNRSRLAYRTSTVIPKVTDETALERDVPIGRKIEQPKISTNEEIDAKPGRGFYPTLKPSDLFVNRYDNQHQNPDEFEDEEFEDNSEEEPPVINPLIKYLQTVRNQESVEENISEDEPLEETEEYDDEVEEDKSEDIPYSNIPRYNIPIPKSAPASTPNQNIPTRISNRPQFNRPVASNVPRRPESVGEARPANEPRRPEANRPVIDANRPGLDRPVVESNRPDFNTPIVEARPNEPRKVEPNRLLGEPNRPAVPRPGPARNYPRKFNKPVYSSTTTTTERLTGIDFEAVNARNKNLFNKNRKMNIAPSVLTTAENNEDAATTTPSEITYKTVQITEETTSVEPTTEQSSTLHHIFAEPDIPQLETTTISMETTTYNLTAAQLEAARSLERLIEVNRIVEVSFKDDSSSGLSGSRVMLERVPTLDRIGAINRVTVIKVVDGGNETNATFPSHHAVTLNEIVTGRRIESGRKVNLEAQLHAPDIHQTKMTIFNNTIEIIESLRSAEDGASQEVPLIPTDEVPTVTELPAAVTTLKIDFTTPSEASNEVASVSFNEASLTTISTLDVFSSNLEDQTTTTTDPFLDQVNHDSGKTVPNTESAKFEIYSKSNVVDYSRRDPNQVIANAQQSERTLEKEGRKLAIDSKSVVANNNHPVFNDGTALPIEVLFQTDYNRESSTLPTLKEVVTGKGNLIDDDQDLLESQHGRVRIRILGQDNEYDTKYEIHEKPVLIPIRVLNEELKTEKAEVVEITPSPLRDTIRIAPIEVAVAQRVPIVRVESSVSQEGDSISQERDQDPNLRLYGRPFNGEVIFGEAKS